jgi:hypothetical protein
MSQILEHNGLIGTGDHFSEDIRLKLLQNLHQNLITQRTISEELCFDFNYASHAVLRPGTDYNQTALKLIGRLLVCNL